MTDAEEDHGAGGRGVTSGSPPDIGLLFRRWIKRPLVGTVLVTGALGIAWFVWGNDGGDDGRSETGQMAGQIALIYLIFSVHYFMNWRVVRKAHLAGEDTETALKRSGW